QAENEEFLKNPDENIQKIIKEQVKEQVKVQVSKILLRIEQTMNEQLEAKVLTRSSNSSKTSYSIAADLSEMELKKILIKKIEGNKSIHRSNEQRNLYKALVEAYESDKIILDTYGDTVTLKRCRDDDADKDEEPFAGSDRGSKRQREGKEPDESAIADEPMQTTHEMEEPSHPEFEIGADDQPITESSHHPEWFSQQKKPPTPDQANFFEFVQTNQFAKAVSSILGIVQRYMSLSVSSQFVTSMLNPSPDACIDSLFETTPRVDVQVSTTVAPLTLTAPPPTIPIISEFARVVYSIPGIVERYMDQRMNEAVKVAVQIQSDRLRDEAQAKNEEFFNNLDDNF
nr:hypothetical protein [Tanacetum cinerariifolium]